MSDFTIEIIPFVPALSVLVAALGLAFAAYRLWRQWRASALLVRYEAVRDKRAVAKALRCEISEIQKALPDRIVKPSLYYANADKVGRMDDEAIESSIKFYAYVDGNTKIDQAEASKWANTAVHALDTFLEKSSKERQRLDAKIKL